MTGTILPIWLVALAASFPCAAQKDYCGLISRQGALGLKPPSTDADQIITEISKNASFTTSNLFWVGDSQDPTLKTQGAVAEICNGVQRYIFYNTDFVKGIRTQKGNDWSKYFTFAHEMAHHVNGDSLLNHENDKVELAADHSAAAWLTRRGATLPEIVSAIDALGFNEEPRQGYPGRCQRRAEAILGYDDVAREYNEHGAKMPVYEACGCLAVTPPGGGLYARGDLPARGPLRRANVVSCGAGFLPLGPDLPRNFAHDAEGMCPVLALHEGDRLTWDNIGVCSLMPGKLPITL